MVLTRDEMAETTRWPPFTLRDEDLVCHFCGKHSRSVDLLIAGHRGAFICEECVELCEEIRRDRKKGPTMEFKAVRKELSVPDIQGNESSNIVVDYDNEFRNWTASVSLASWGGHFKTAEEAVLALEEPTNDLLRAIRGSQPIGKVLPRKRLRTFAAMTHEDAEAMRVVRNSCREFMTRNTDLIESHDQLRWFDELDRQKMIPLLAVLEEDMKGLPKGTPVGYGISQVAEEHGQFRKLVTGGVIPDLRGMGLGEELFRDVIVWAGIPCWLEVLDSNTKAINLYKKLGFKARGGYTRGDKEYTLMRLDTLPL